MKQATKYPRKTRTYKVKDVVYNKARRRAKKEGGHLATLIEGIVMSYANGWDIKLDAPVTN